MKHRLSKLFTAGLLMSLCISCGEIEQPEDEKTNEDENKSENVVVIPVELSCELLDTEKNQQTRSTHDDATLRKITNVNYYLFKDGTYAGQQYFADADDFEITLPSLTDKYNVYILANVGQKAISTATAESAMATAVHQDYGSYSNYFTVIERDGFPMSTIIRDFSATSGGDYTLRRLVHTLYVSANTDGLTSTTMEFTSLSIKNAARDVYPFATESKAQYVMDGDAANLSDDEMDAINNGERVTLYLLENMRGDLFSGNTDWKEKVPANMTPPSERDFCSYIELTASAQTATAKYDCNTYRAYIGTSAADCDVMRHSYFTISNSFTNDMIVDEEWRIESDTPQITGKLLFVKSMDSSVSLSERTITRSDFYPGFKREFYIYRSNPDIKYTLTGPFASELIEYSTTKIDDYYTKVTVWSDSAIWQKPSETSTYYRSTFRITSEDGLLSSSLSCYVQRAPLNVTFKYTERDLVYDNTYSRPGLRMSINNLYGLKFKVDIEGYAGYYNKHYPKGTKRDPDTKSGTYQFATGTTSAIYPEANTYVFIDDQTADNSAFKSIDGAFYWTAWTYRGFQSTNWFDASSDNGYTKYADPAYLILYITLKYGKPEDGTLYPASSTATIPFYVTNSQKTAITGGYTGAGTDFGIFVDETFYLFGSESANSELHSFNKSYHTDYDMGTLGRIAVYVNNKDKWTDDRPSMQYLGY